MDEYIAETTLTLKGRPQIPPGHTIYAINDRFTICRKFYKYCDIDPEFFEYYFKSGKVTVCDLYYVIQYAFERLSARFFEYTLKFTKWPVTRLVCSVFAGDLYKMEMYTTNGFSGSITFTLREHDEKSLDKFFNDRNFEKHPRCEIDEYIYHAKT